MKILKQLKHLILKGWHGDFCEEHKVYHDSSGLFNFCPECWKRSEEEFDKRYEEQQERYEEQQEREKVEQRDQRIEELAQALRLTESELVYTAKLENSLADLLCLATWFQENHPDALDQIMIKIRKERAFILLQSRGFDWNAFHKNGGGN